MKEMSSGSSRPSLIDKIFITSLNFDAGSGNLIHKITDHMPNFVTLKRKIIKNYKTKAMKYYFCNLKQTLSNIYEAFILPYINHCTIIWGGICTILCPGSKSLKKAARIIFFKKQSARSRPLYKHLKSQTLEDRYNLDYMNFMLDISREWSKDFFSNYFWLSKDRHKMQHTPSNFW